MTRFDVFNGDADGICALLQLRLANPLDTVLVTGAKRDIALLERVDAHSGDAVTVLDIAVAANRPALQRLLDHGVTVQYFDHHYAGQLPVHAGFDAHLDASPSVCTGLLVDRYLGGSQRVWAVVAAYGDNLVAVAQALAAPLALHAEQRSALHDLADCLTYNATGDSVDDAIIHPATLFGILLRYAEPFRFMASDPAFLAIDAARRRDLDAARRTRPAHRLPGATVYVLPDAPWARRVRGIFGNEVAHAAPHLAHAVLTANADGGYIVSVRAPRERAEGADALCRQFPGGGGRQAAAGIDRLSEAQLDGFVRALAAAYPGIAPGPGNPPPR